MPKIGPILLKWEGKKESSSDDWILDRKPTGKEERSLLPFPNLMTSDKDVHHILRNIDYASEIREKNRFARFSYRVTLAWIVLLASVVGLQGFTVWRFKLTEGEFIAFVTTTTLDVLGFSYLVGRHLFPSAKPIENQTEELQKELIKELTPT